MSPAVSRVSGRLALAIQNATGLRYEGGVASQNAAASGCARRRASYSAGVAKKTGCTPRRICSRHRPYRLALKSTLRTVTLGVGASAHFLPTRVTLPWTLTRSPAAGASPRGRKRTRASSTA